VNIQAEGVTSSTEVPEKARRRRFTAAYKERILVEADACTKAGEMGALLRREGLYSSHLTAWRAARRDGGQDGLKAKPRGPKPKSAKAKANDKRVAQLEREVRRLTARAELAEGLVALQKKVAALLGSPLTDDDEPS
jgi:transposase